MGEWASTLLGLAVFAIGMGVRAVAISDDARWLKLASDARRPDGLRGTYVAARLGAASMSLGLAWLGWCRFGPLGLIASVGVTAPLMVLADLLPRALARPHDGGRSPSAWTVALGRALGPLEAAATAAGERAWTHEGLTPLVRIVSATEDAAERNMARRVYDFGDLMVADIMVPLVDVIAVRDDSPIDEVVRIATGEGFSRLPVYHERLPNVVGILHVFDLLVPAGARTAAERMNPPTFVPEMARANDVLRRLQVEGVNLAIVVDEYGGAVGIVAVEDILEEVVGEIEDEYDEEEELVRLLGPGEWVVDGRAEIEWLNERFSWRLPEGEYDTLGGLVLSHLSRIPEVGETLPLEHVDLAVAEASPRSVDAITVRLHASTPHEEARP